MVHCTVETFDSKEECYEKNKKKIFQAELEYILQETTPRVIFFNLTILLQRLHLIPFQCRVSQLRMRDEWRSAKPCMTSLSSSRCECDIKDLL